MHGENSLCEDSQENAENEEQWGGLASIEIYYYKVTANETRRY